MKRPRGNVSSHIRPLCSYYLAEIVSVNKIAVVGSHLSENLCAFNTLAIFMCSAICLPLHMSPASPEHHKAGPRLSEGRGGRRCCPAAPFNEVLKVCGQGCFPSVPMETRWALRAGVSSPEIKMNQWMTCHLAEAWTQPWRLQLVPKTTLFPAENIHARGQRPKPHPDFTEHTVSPDKVVSLKRSFALRIAK